MKIKEQKLFYCFEGEVDIVNFAKNFYAKTGVKIMAEKEGDEVEGYIVAYHYPEGFKGVCNHGCIVDGKEHTCLQVFFYDEDEAPDFEATFASDEKGKKKLLKSSGHKTTLKGLSKIKEKKIMNFEIDKSLKKIHNIIGDEL